MDSTVAEYLDEVDKMGHEDFLCAYPYPVLLHRKLTLHSSKSETALIIRTRLATPRPAFSTVDGEHESEPELLTDSADDLELVVRPLNKRPGNPYENNVTIGRAANNDIVLDTEGVSKLHAYITWTSDRSQYMIADAGSTNHTYLRGRCLVAKQSEVLSSGRDLLRFATTRCAYFAPVAFSLWLRNLKRSW